MDFPPHFDNLALQLMFSHFFLATLSFTITFSIGQTSKNLGHCFVWSNLLLKCENITQLKHEIVKVWKEIHVDKDLLRRRCRCPLFLFPFFLPTFPFFVPFFLVPFFLPPGESVSFSPPGSENWKGSLTYFLSSIC